MKRVFLLLLLALTFGFSQAAFAEQECCWIDVKTGKRVPTVPASGVNYASDPHLALEGGVGVASLSKDGKTAYNQKTGKNYAKEPDGCWIDVKTGKQVPSVPSSGVNYASDPHLAGEGGVGVALLSKDGKTAYNPKTGQNYAREPCPPPAQTTGDTIKKVLQSVNIGIGIGGGHTFGHDERHHGEDRHRTAEKVSTDKTKTHTTSPTTTHKTVTSACKCHRCTCSPCHCGG